MQKYPECPISDPMELFRENRKRLVDKLVGDHKGSVVLLQGGNDLSHYSTDVDYEFRQEPYFHWCFGVREPGFYGAVCVGSGRSVLFMPRLPEEYATWMGKLLTPTQVASTYKVDEVYFNDEIDAFMRTLNPDFILTLYGRNSDSGLFTKEADFEGISNYKINRDVLFDIISNLRVYKTPREIELMRHVAVVSSDAHKYVLKNMKPGMKEYQGEAMFKYFCYYEAGCRHTAYTCICGSGHNGSTLHYGHAAAPNDKVIARGDMCLFDMGASYLGYSADITVSFPVDGKFTDRQKVIYNAVLKARNAVIASVKPGASWVDLHDSALSIILTALKDYGALKGDVGEMMRCGLGATFMPHGLGHLLGIDVHDCGGYIKGTPDRPVEPWRKSLRTARILEQNMVLTVEPGCYFIDHLLDKALADETKKKFLVQDVINELRGFGGVRIEDDVLVTERGCEIFGSLPRTVQEIESFMKI